MKYCCIILLTYIAISWRLFVDGNPYAKRLYDHLLRGGSYSKVIRPVGNSSQKVIVKISLKLSQLIDLVRISLQGFCEYITIYVL